MNPPIINQCIIPKPPSLYVIPRGMRNNNPPNENHTSAYIARVSQMSGIHPDEPLDFNDRGQMTALVRAMAYVENGIPPDDDSLRRGYEMAR